MVQVQTTQIKVFTQTIHLLIIILPSKMSFVYVFSL